MKIIIFVPLTILIILGFIFLPTLSSNKLPLSPLSSNPPVFEQISLKKPIIYGFLPYWNLNKLSDTNLTQLTDLAYFGLTLNESGELIKNDLGYRRFLTNYSLLKNLSQSNQLNLHLVLKFSSDQELFNFLHNEAAYTTLFKDLSALNSQYPVDGYNIDFEPDSATDSATITRFTEFISSFRSSMEPSKQLTIDIYPSAATSPKLWDLPVLAPLTDQFIVMAYDYTRANSSNTGPIAPIYPPPGKSHALIPNLKEISSQVSPSQLLIGLPLYGYEWSTTSPAPNALVTKNSGQLATYKRIHQIIKNNEVKPSKDPLTLSSRLLLNQNGSFSQIYFEDKVTLFEKAKLIRDGQFGGAALWALGYEGEFDIWSPLKRGLGLND